MKLRFALLLTLFSACAVGQSRPNHQQPLSKDKMKIAGLELSLGLAEDKVVAELTRGGYQVTGSAGNYTVFQQHPDRLPSLMGTVAFKNGKLSFASKLWTPDETDGPAVVEGIYRALSAYQQEGRRTCYLNVQDQQNPTSEMKSVTLNCQPGQRYLSITTTRYEGRDLVSIEEILRTPE